MDVLNHPIPARASGTDLPFPVAANAAGAVECGRMLPYPPVVCDPLRPPNATFRYLLEMQVLGPSRDLSAPAPGGGRLIVARKPLAS